MHASSIAALQALPPGLARQARAHVEKYPDSIDDLIGEIAIALLSLPAGTAHERVFDKARSACREFTQDLAYYSGVIDDDEEDIVVVKPADPRRERVAAKIDIKEIQDRYKVGRARAYQIRAQLVAEEKCQADMFDEVAA